MLDSKWAPERCGRRHFATTVAKDRGWSIFIGLWKIPVVWSRYLMSGPCAAIPRPGHGIPERRYSPGWPRDPRSHQGVHQARPHSHVGEYCHMFLRQIAMRGERAPVANQLRFIYLNHFQIYKISLFFQQQKNLATQISLLTFCKFYKANRS